MAQSTWLQLVSGEEIRHLKENPGSIDDLDKAESFRTHFGLSLNYFLTGATYPNSPAHPLYAALDGAESVACPTLENAYFGVVTPEQAADLAAHLAAVDPAAVQVAVERADFEELVDEQEIHELEIFPPDEVPGLIVAELKELTAFYARAADAGLGAVMYTT
ncbi:DUF1877 family protein [Streptomyces sp. NPDC018693]|uniref:DUF1877 family protein n=1 Tax=unclassified Streptomyces TaxID=2593676 RepID=UPI0037924B8D